MLIVNAIDNGLACDFGVSRVFFFDISPILQEIFSLKMGFTYSLSYFVYSIY